MPLLRCIECERESLRDANRWEAHLTDRDDDGRRGIVVYCPTCAAREFGPHD